jgi:hypothetical protein
MSTALLATPRSIFSNDYHIIRDEEPVAELNLANFRDHCEVELDGYIYHIRRDGRLKRSFSLEQHGEVMARAKQVSLFRRTIEMEFSGRSVQLKPLSIMNPRRCGVFFDGQQQGLIEPVRWYSRKKSIEVSDEIPTALQLFLFTVLIFNERKSH